MDYLEEWAKEVLNDPSINRTNSKSSRSVVAEAKARATVAEKVAAGEVAWEGKMADATVDSWKDEFALVVLLAPAILVFIPGMREYVQSGFEVLATLPDWYQYLLYIAISASFGIKGVGQAAKMLKRK